MTKSNFIYNALPYMYTSGGVVAMLISGETIGRFSGALLVSAAMVIFHMRLEYRTLRAQSAEDTSKISLSLMRSQIN
jgi:hypothetical protein